MIFSDVVRLLSVVWVCVLSLAPCGARAQDGMPDNWPWRGVTVVFPSGGVADLERYKKELNINLVRLNINVKQYGKSKRLGKDQAWQAAMLWSDAMLDACARLGIGATVEVNQFPLDPSQSEQMRTPRFWGNKDMMDEIAWVAGRLAERHGHRGRELAAYQLLSEPVVFRNGRAEQPQQWGKLLERIVSEIRKSDKQRWIVVSPGPGGGPNGYADFVPPSDPRLIWGVHMYLPHAFTHQGIKAKAKGVRYPGRIGLKYWDKEALRAALEPLRSFQKQHPRPVFVGEFSAVRWAEGGEQYVGDLASIFDEYGWGWTYFSASGWHGFNPDYDNKFSGNDPQDWKEHFVGDKSPRWQTLRSIFRIQGHQ